MVISSASRTDKPFAVIHSGECYTSAVLINLLHDTSPPVLALLAEKHGLQRIPGLTARNLITRILARVADEDLLDLQNELVAARFGALPIDALLEIALIGEQDHKGGGSKPRMDQISLDEATLLRSGPPRWDYTMRGHDQVIDVAQRLLACDCEFFSFASKRQVLCKHLATAFKLIPSTYAREALIDLLVVRRYGDRQEDRWDFDSPRAA
ncbi:MAG: hypothetical protein JXB07_00295 [Anaerolineae bacterium]|nr:hypothetical protein [Anaerolineae bacterium]